MKKVLLVFAIYILFFAGLFYTLDKTSDNSDEIHQHLDNISVMVESTDGYGSGTIVNNNDDSFILTCNHIIISNIVSNEPVKIVKIFYEDGKTVGQLIYTTSIVAHSAKEDLAILKVNKKSAFPYGVKFYTDQKYKIPGTKIYNVGSSYGPMGYNSFSEGVIANHGRFVNGKYMSQANNMVHSGNSGSGIFLENGQYIGMVMSNHSKSPTMGYYYSIQNIRHWASNVGYGYLFGDMRLVGR